MAPRSCFRKKQHDAQSFTFTKKAYTLCRYLFLLSFSSIYEPMLMELPLARQIICYWTELNIVLVLIVFISNVSTFCSYQQICRYVLIIFIINNFIANILYFTLETLTATHKKLVTSETRLILFKMTDQRPSFHIIMQHNCSLKTLWPDL